MSFFSKPFFLTYGFIAVFLFLNFTIGFFCHQIFAKNFLNQSQSIMFMLVLFFLQIGILFTALTKSRKKIIFDAKTKEKLKQKKIEIKEAEKKLHDLNDRLIEGVIVVDYQMRLKFLNHSARNILGFNKSISNCSLAQIVRAPNLYEKLEQVRSGSLSAEGFFELSPNLDRHIFFRIQNLSQWQNFLINLVDVSHEKAIEKNYQEFIARASHELKTPASIILANSELLLTLAPKESADLQFLIKAIFRQAQKQKDLLDTLMEMARLESGQFKVNLKKVFLKNFLNELILSLGDLGKNIELQCRSDTCVLADEKLLERMVLIILENANKYGGENPRISISLKELEHKIYLRISDDGPGIKPEWRGRVFEKFCRGDAKRTFKKEGFGLGLTIAKSLSDAQNISIFIEEEKSGCTFCLAIPRALPSQIECV